MSLLLLANTGGRAWGVFRASPAAMSPLHAAMLNVTSDYSQASRGPRSLTGWGNQACQRHVDRFPALFTLLAIAAAVRKPWPHSQPTPAVLLPRSWRTWWPISCTSRGRTPPWSSALLSFWPSAPPSARGGASQPSACARMHRGRQQTCAALRQQRIALLSHTERRTGAGAAASWQQLPRLPPPSPGRSYPRLESALDWLLAIYKFIFPFLVSLLPTS